MPSKKKDAPEIMSQEQSRRASRSTICCPQETKSKKKSTSPSPVNLQRRRSASAAEETIRKLQSDFKQSSGTQASLKPTGKPSQRDPSPAKQAHNNSQKITQSSSFNEKQRRNSREHSPQSKMILSIKSSAGELATMFKQNQRKNSRDNSPQGKSLTGGGNGHGVHQVGPQGGPHKHPHNDSSPQRQEWAKLTDRTLSTEERKRLARAAAQKLFASKNNPQRPQPVLTQNNSIFLKTTRAPTPPSRTVSMGKEVSRDFLTLACYNAVATGQLGLLKAIQKTGRAPQVDKQGNTPLHVAAKCGQLKCLKWLTQYCSIPLLAKNARGETCAHLAALHGNLKCLQAILAEPKDLVGALGAAAERDNAGMTCLHHATMGNRDATVAWLAATFGKDLCLVKSMDGVLAIHLATASGNMACTEALIEACRPSVNMRDVFGATPVFYAAQEGQLDILKYLVEEADGSLDLVACEGMTPMLTAAEGGHVDIIKYIVDTQGKGALLATTHDGANAFHYAAGNGNASVLQFLLESPERGEMLGVADMFERTPAHDAAENGHAQCLQLLAEHGVSLYLPDKDGETALSMAMRSCNVQCVMFARALAEAAVEKCNSKSFKKKLGSKLTQISGIMSIRAIVNNREEKEVSQSRCGGIFDCSKFPFVGKRGRKKMGQQESVHADTLDPCGPTTWPAWHQSLAPRGPTRPSGRGIFRGEFILLRSSPPGSRNRDGWKGPGHNGHLYAQRNRPCPISLPLGRNDYPASRLHQVGLDEEELLGDGLERFLHHKVALDALRGHHVLRHGPRDPALGDIREEEEEFESVSSYEGRNTNPYKCPPSIYSCSCGGQPDKMAIKQQLAYNDLHYTTQGRRTSKQGREIMKSSKITLPPVKEDQQERPTTPMEDYSSDESGISDHGMHSDQEDKVGYGMSSGDEAVSHHSKRPSCASSDSAMRDSDNLSQLSSEGECPHHGLDDPDDRDHSFRREDDALVDLDLVTAGQLNTSVLTEVTVHSDDCSSLFSHPRHDGEETSHLSVSEDSSSESYVSHSVLSFHGSQTEMDKRARSASPMKRGKVLDKVDARSRSEKTPSSGKIDDSHLYSEISDEDQSSTLKAGDKKREPSSSRKSERKTPPISPSTPPPHAPPPPPPPPAPPAPPPPPPAPPVPSTSPPAKSRQSLSSSTSSSSSSSSSSPTTPQRASPTGSVGTLADVLRQSISDGTFSRHNTLRRRESISPTRQKVCHPVFDSSSLKRTDVHSNSSTLRRQYRESRQDSNSSASSAGGSSGPDVFDEKEELQSGGDEEVEVNRKCADKIKALQSILIKQAIPFANPALMKGCRSRSVSRDRLDDKKPGSGNESPKSATSESRTSTSSSSAASTRSASASRSSMSGSEPPSPIPKTSGNITSPDGIVKPQKSRNIEEAMTSGYGRPSCYATISRLEKSDNDSCFDEDTRSRIASVKDKLQKAIPTSDHSATLARS